MTSSPSFSRLSLCLAGILLALPTFAAEPPPVRKVTVVGTAVIKVAPDEMHWSVQVSVNDATLAKAKSRHDASLAAALKYLKGINGIVKDLQTGGIRFDKQTYFPPNTDRSKPFTCSTQLTFTLIDFDKYGPICDELATHDGTQVLSVDYASSKAESLRRDALKKALVNAHDKAVDLAATAGCYMDKPLEIIEGTTDNGPRPMMMRSTMNLGGDSGTPPAVPGQIEITGTVTATYDLYYK